jgi:hypothetical protein
LDKSGKKQSPFFYITILLFPLLLALFLPLLDPPPQREGGLYLFFSSPSKRGRKTKEGLIIFNLQFFPFKKRCNL